MSHNFSHSLSSYSGEQITERLEVIKQRLKSETKASASGYSTDELIDIAQELKSFDLGRFLLINRGMDGYWTDYILTLPREEITKLPELEQALFNSRVFKATYQRHQIFKRENQAMLNDGNHLAAIPSGLMSELMDLDYSDIDFVGLSAIDIDPQAFIYLKQKHNELYTRFEVETVCADALSFVREEAFDLITSNGLTIYMKDDHEVQQLFNNFHESLKPYGKLVTSFLTFPNTFGDKSEQRVATDAEQDKLAIAVFIDILQVNWSCYRTTTQMKEMLVSAGFSGIEVFGDENYVFPTIIGYKK